MPLVNDVHSALNPTQVARVLRPASIGELQDAIRATASARRSLSICGARHAMGSQQFRTEADLLDLTALDRVLSVDTERGLVTAEAGITWPALIQGYLDAQRRAEPAREPRWGINQKQTGADHLTLGGALAANAHGRGLILAPIVQDVESFTLVAPDGSIIDCSRQHNSELFRHAIGGYGLFGAIATVTLRLVPRRVLRRVVRVIDIDDAANAARRRIDDGFIYGDFQFDIDPASPEFLTKGVFSCYHPVDAAMPPRSPRELTRDDWAELLYLAHTDKRAAFARYAQHYVATDGELYWSDLHQLGVYLDGYHELLDRRLGSPCRCSEMITELYVPHDRLIDFLRAAARGLAQRGADVIYGTIRLIRRDAETALPWAHDDRACVIFNLHVRHTPEGVAHAADSFRMLIDLALDRGGSFFLTYHRFATREQLFRAHPGLPAFLRAKDRHDPSHVFDSDWHRWVRSTIGV